MIKSIVKFFGEAGWILIGIWVILTIIFGCIGYWDYFEKIHPENQIFFGNVLYATLKLFVLETDEFIIKINWQLEFARYSAMFIAFFAIFQTVVYVLSDRIALFKIHFYKNHIIICGLSEKGFRLTKQFLKDGEKVVVIELNKDNEHIKEIESRGAVVLKGYSAEDRRVLTKANVQKAKYLFAVTSNDETNFDVLSGIPQYALTKDLRSFIHIYDSRLHRLFADQPEFSQTGALKASMFNLFEKGAHEIFNMFPPDRYIKTVKPDDPPLHIMILGLEQLGESIIIQAARTGQYANGKKLIVTVIDTEMSQAKLKLESKARIFRSVFPNIDRIIDLRFESKPAELLNEENIRELEKEAPFSVSFVSLNDDSYCLVMGRLLNRLFTGRNTQIVVSMSPESGLGRFSKFSDKNYHVFGLMDAVCTKNVIVDDEESIDVLAGAVHEQYIRREKLKGNVQGEHLKPWKKLNRTYKEANRRSAEHMFIKLRYLGVDTIGEEEIKPEDIKISEEDTWILAKMEKKRWNADRWLDGWEYGQVRDNSRKIHNMLIPWEELSQEEKQKDANNVLIIPELLKLSGIKLYKF
ncbi:MAG: hypothetical protein FJ216_06685 [Ignavibacteria bacterium]|nr:hypothetical protein [Ignavibacteria bacterium]